MRVRFATLFIFSSILIICSSTFTTTLFAQTNSAASTTNPIVSFAYVGAATTPNTISVFAVRQNGLVQTVSGSPFAGPSASLVVSSGFVRGTDGKNIVTYSRHSNGALQAISTIDGTAHNDTPTGSAVGDLTLDRTARSLYVGEIDFQGADNNAYAEFAAELNGTLVFQQNSNIDVDFGGPLEFSHDNQFAYGTGCFFITWDIFAFHRLTDGTLKFFDPGNTVPPAESSSDQCPGVAATSAKGFLAVAFGPASGTAKRSLITYLITSTGGLQEITNSVLATNFTAINGMKFDPTGNFLAVAGRNGVELFRLNSNGTFSRLGPVADTGVNFQAVRWDNFGHVYALSHAALHVFNAHLSGLTDLSAHGVASPQSLAVLPVQ
jgi:hypothetical protein